MTGRLPRDFMKVLRRGRTTVVSIVSDKLLDERTVRRFTERLFILADDAQGRGLHLDLQNVEHVSSLALSNLITVHKRLQYGGGKLTLCNVRPPLAEILCLPSILRRWRMKPAARSRRWRLACR